MVLKNSMQGSSDRKMAGERWQDTDPYRCGDQCQTLGLNIENHMKSHEIHRGSGYVFRDPHKRLTKLDQDQDFLKNASMSWWLAYNCSFKMSMSLLISSTFAWSSSGWRLSESHNWSSQLPTCPAPAQDMGLSENVGYIPNEIAI